MASNLQEAQSALKLCEIHESKELTSYCRTCKIPICTQCVKSVHMQHDWDNINTVARERRAHLPTLCRKIKSEDLHSVRQKLVDPGTLDEEDSDTQKIIARKEALIKNINILVNKKIELSKKRGRLNPTERKRLERSLEFLEKMTTELDMNVGTFSDFDVLEMEQEMAKELEALRSLHIGETKERALFTPGEMNLKTLDDMIGQVHDPSSIVVDGINAFPIDDLRCHRICAVKGCYAWISNLTESELCLVDCYGKILKKQKLKQYHFVVTESIDIIYTDKDTKTIQVMTNAGVSRVLQQTYPLIPTCISLTNDLNILVTIRDDAGLNTITSSSRRLVQKINLEGKILQSFEFAEDGKTRLFKRPFKTAENKNKDICIINRRNDTTGELITLKPNGRIRFRYRGLSARQTFDPSDVLCDSSSRILLTCEGEKSVYVLASDGTFIKHLLRELNSEPTALSLYEDKLWLVCNDKTIHVYSLRSETVVR